MQANDDVQLIVDGKPLKIPIPRLDDADAVFLTQSAVAKFILPYYMRFKTGNQVGALENSLFNNEEVVAAFHIPGSLTFPVAPKVGVVKVNKRTGACECQLIPVDDDGAPPGAETAKTRTNSGRSPAKSTGRR